MEDLSPNHVTISGHLAKLANMADPVNMHEAKTELSRLVERALQGEDVVIARAGVPVVRLVPVVSRGKRTLGQWRGQLRMSDDFDAPLAQEELDAWEGDRSFQMARSSDRATPV